MTDTKRHKFQCPDCGSKNVFVEACVRWDENNQDWELDTVHDIATCNDCLSETYPEYFFQDIQTGAAK